MFFTPSGMGRVQRHRVRPVPASSAATLLGGSVTYMTPSTTSGVVSTSPGFFTW